MAIQVRSASIIFQLLSLVIPTLRRILTILAPLLGDLPELHLLFTLTLHADHFLGLRNQSPVFARPLLTRIHREGRVVGVVAGPMGVVCRVTTVTSPTARALSTSQVFIHVLTAHASKLGTREAKARKFAGFQEFDLLPFHVGELLVTCCPYFFHHALHSSHLLRLILQKLSDRQVPLVVVHRLVPLLQRSVISTVHVDQLDKAICGTSQYHRFICARYVLNGFDDVLVLLALLQSDDLSFLH